jgi:cystathionine gamma-synthase
MSAIFNTHRNLLKAKGERKAVVFGYVTPRFHNICTNDCRFPYIDTLKITEKFGPGSQFYGFGSSEELDDLERRLEGGERFVALFTEFPSNPLLRTPDLERIRNLANKYDFCVVVDESVGNFINVNVLPYADVVVSSLTKVFSGDSNVMGGG